MDKAKLVKLLNLSASDFDGESLSAIRMANKMIKEDRTTWDEIIQYGDFKKKAKEEADRSQRQDRSERRHSDPFASSSFGSRGDGPSSVSEILDECLYGVTGSGAEFIESLAAQYRQRGRLTERQTAALIRFWENLK